ncbi:MAG: Mo-dependent nitrogenase C-terminal domain-containing protein [Cyanobacteria bacterium J06633_2]
MATLSRPSSPINSDSPMHESFISDVHAPHHPPLDVLTLLRQWIDGLTITNPRQAHFICRLIPCNCPFERDIKLFQRTLVHIPALCKLNPLYMECVSLRFRALSYLTDECNEDVTRYIC